MTKTWKYKESKEQTTLFLTLAYVFMAINSFTSETLFQFRLKL